jgi:hypothetical protein
MNQQTESSISIINKNNGSLTGEQANALPIMIKTSFSWIKIFLTGVVLTFVVLFVIFLLAKTQVQTVEIVGTSDNFQILELK